MKRSLDKLEFEASGEVRLDGGELMTEIPDVVTERVSAELGDIEIKEFNVSIKEDEDEQTFEWYVHGRRDPLSL